MNRAVFGMLVATLAACACAATSDSSVDGLEFSESVAEERRQIGIDAVNQIQFPEGFEIQATQGTPADAPSLTNQNNPLPGSFAYNINVETDFAQPVWINQLKAEIESHGQLERYERREPAISACTGKVYTMSFRHVETGDLLLVGYNRDRPLELEFYYRYSAGGIGSFGPVEQLFPHPGPACEVS